MPMIPFVERFRELGIRETRSVIIADRDELSAGEYGFFEFYCNEPECDCRRVIICVLRPETGWGEVWATIGYGWESLDFYRDWSHGHSDPVEMKGPYLDPLNVQTDSSPALLDIFRSMIESPEYVERLKTHYRMFRDSLGKGPGDLEARRVENRRKHVRDPRRRRRPRA